MHQKYRVNIPSVFWTEVISFVIFEQIMNVRKPRKYKVNQTLTASRDKIYDRGVKTQ